MPPRAGGREQHDAQKRAHTRRCCRAPIAAAAARAWRRTAIFPAALDSCVYHLGARCARVARPAHGAQRPPQPASHLRLLLRLLLRLRLRALPAAPAAASAAAAAPPAATPPAPATPPAAARVDRHGAKARAARAKCARKGKETRGRSPSLADFPELAAPGPPGACSRLALPLSGNASATWPIGEGRGPGSKP